MPASLRAAGLRNEKILPVVSLNSLIETDESRERQREAEEQKRRREEEKKRLHT